MNEIIKYNSVLSFLRGIIAQPKIVFLKHYFNNKEFKLLDIGCGNSSAYYFKKYFINCRYYGLDVCRTYNNNADDFNLMTEFYEKDLNNCDFGDIPDEYFDAINMTHILEHLINGDKILEELIPKLRKDGVLYIEYPNIRSISMPSMKNTLNFFDDPSHVRVYQQSELLNILLKNNFRIIKADTRHSFRLILLMPFLVIYHFVKKGYLSGHHFWDLFGFADFIFAKKK